ncbi:hypothetical protein AAE478_001058 [Parahypoxylon ruwenzoriense]
MRTATLFGALAILSVAPNVSAMLMTLLPMAAPTVTRDPWQCATENLTQYFDVPKPTGSLLTALDSYASELFKTCTAAGAAAQSCPFPEQSLWCSFGTAAPSTVLADYSSYGSVASSWWSARSSAAVFLAQDCASSWWKVMTNTPNGQVWLNETIIFAGCYSEAHPTVGKSTLGPSATPGSAVTKSGPTPTVTPR